MLSVSSLGNLHALRTRRAALVAAGFTALLVLAVLPPPAAAAEGTTLPPLGMSIASIAPLKAAGAAPKYGSYWVGEWMATSGWGGFDKAMTTAKAEGVTPVLYWYYWGDSISPTCFDADGCDGRTEAEWYSLTDQLAAKISYHFAGAEVLVVLENEFNKGGIADSYAPTFDAKLEKVALKLNAVDGVALILGFGNWGEASWGKFPRSIAQSEYIGYQMMRASTKDTEASYRGAADRSAYLSNYIATKFDKPSFLYDVALSSYPDASWEKIQAETLDAIFQKLQTSGSTGLQGVVYRSLNDNWMDPKNYYGLAESHWGLRTNKSVPKPAFDVWIKHATGAASPEPEPPATNVPGSFEAETMTATKGGLRTDAAASGGAAWNLWANGQLSTQLVSDGAQPLRVSVVAMGQSAGGVDARMTLKLGATTLLNVSVAPGAYRAFAVDTTIPNGSTTLTVLFTNDGVVGTEDRNLIVDVVRIAAAPVNRAPAAAFTSAVDGLSAAFDASGSSDADGDALTYAWSFGDGATATGAKASHAYATGGTYAVKLTVSDGRASATKTANVTVARPNAAPSAAFTALVEGLLAKVDASSSSDANGDALTYAWTFGDGSSASGMTAQRAYAASGEYTITLVVSDGALSSTASRTVAVVRPNTAPVAAFTATAQHLTASFDASGSSDADGDALTYAWSFGDGASATGAKATRAYAAPGTYAVKLTVSDGNATSTSSRNVTVTYPAPVAKASANGTNATRTFDGSGSQDPAGGALAYAWAFSDGGSATGAVVSRTFPPGNHTATLTVTNRFGDAATAKVVVSIAPPPPPTYAPEFTPVNGNANWVQVMVKANERTTAVCVTVDAAACKPLALKSWGDWAAALKVPANAKVTYTATSASGQKVTSEAFLGATAKPYVPPMTATFTPHGGNEYWVQTKVESNRAIASVCASVDGGACRPLELRSWGSWAASFYVKPGAIVKFTATSTSGEKVTSQGYVWPAN